MRPAILSLVVCAGFAALPHTAAAQERDMGTAKPIKVAIHVASVQLAGDTVILTYVVENRPAPISGEDFWKLLVDTPAPAIRVDSPAVAQHWKTATEYRDDPTAVWTQYSNNLVHPGQSSPPLSFRAIGLPDLVQYWAIPNLAAHPPVGEEPDAATSRAGFRQFGDSGMTVGVVPPPANATPIDLSVRVRRLFDHSCGTNQLITNNGICNSLRAKLDAASRSISDGNVNAASGQIGAFLSELDAQRGKFVSEAAYALLRPNAAYLLSRL